MAYRTVNSWTIQLHILWASQNPAVNIQPEVWFENGTQWKDESNLYSYLETMFSITNNLLPFSPMSTSLKTAFILCLRSFYWLIIPIYWSIWAKIQISRGINTAPCIPLQSLLAPHQRRSVIGNGAWYFLKFPINIGEHTPAPMGTRAPARTSEGIYGEGAENKEWSICSDFY